MVKIVIENLAGKVVDVNDPSKSALAHFQENRIDWMQSCGGKGRCTTCKFIVLDGMANLSPLTPAEDRYRRQFALGSNERLSCQVRVTGTIRVEVPKEFQLPHLTYTG